MLLFVVLDALKSPRPRTAQHERRDRVAGVAISVTVPCTRGTRVPAGVTAPLAALVACAVPHQNAVRTCRPPREPSCAPWLRPASKQNLFVALCLLQQAPTPCTTRRRTCAPPACRTMPEMTPFKHFPFMNAGAPLAAIGPLETKPATPFPLRTRAKTLSRHLFLASVLRARTRTAHADIRTTSCKNVVYDRAQACPALPPDVMSTPLHIARRACYFLFFSFLLANRANIGCVRGTPR